MTLTPKKIVILLVVAAAGYFAYTAFRESFSSKTNEDLFAMYAAGDAKSQLAYAELELRVQTDKIKAGDLTGHVKDTNVDCASLALELLAKLKCKEQVPLYVSMLEGRDVKRWKVNEAAADALQATKCPDSKKAVTPLIAILKWTIPSKDGVEGNAATEKVHSAAHAALKEITGQNFKDQFDQWNTWWTGDVQKTFKVQ